jgi:hypothetical protein
MGGGAEADNQAMRFVLMILAVGVGSHAAGQPASDSVVAIAASKFVPDVTWRSQSVRRANFTCEGRRQAAILGTTGTEIVIAVFTNGITRKPEVLPFSARTRDALTSELVLESLENGAGDDAPDLGRFHFSRNCRGLALQDGKVDGVHVYWNPERKQFEWTR